MTRALRSSMRHKPMPVKTRTRAASDASRRDRTQLRTAECDPGEMETGQQGPRLLILVRHGESEWNLEQRFTGWTDVDLTAEGELQARRAGALLAMEGYEFDVAFTSRLKRSIRSQWLMLEALDQTWLPVCSDWRLNERHYGDLTGRTHAEARELYGDDQVLTHGYHRRPGRSI